MDGVHPEVINNKDTFISTHSEINPTLNYGNVREHVCICHSVDETESVSHKRLWLNLLRMGEVQSP